MTDEQISDVRKLLLDKAATDEQINDLRKLLDMAAARKITKQKQSATDLINNLIDDKVRFEIEKMMKSQVSNNGNFISGITTNTFTTKPSKPRAGKFDSPYGSWVESLRVIDETTDLKLEEFTESTHDVLVGLMSKGGSYNETTTSIVVGKDSVEWWEYVLLYGIYKAIKLAVAIDKYGHMIKTPVTNAIVKEKQAFLIQFRPKNSGSIIKRADSIEGEAVYRMIGKKYLNESIVVDLPYNDSVKTTETVKDYLIFENKVDTLEPDLNRFLLNLESTLAEKKVPEKFRLIILKQIYGRLRGI